jgi:hypothetical protein
MAMEMKSGDMPVSKNSLPAIKMTMDVTVNSVSPEGDITYDMVLTGADVAPEEGAVPQIVEAMKASLSGIKGMKGTGSMSNRGFGKSSEIKLPANADAQITQTLDQVKQGLSNLSAQLPEEAIGPGAKWEIMKSIRSQGIAMVQTATSQLVSVDGEHVIVKSALTQQSAKQKIQDPALGGMSMDLTSLKGSGTSEVSSDLEHLLPPEASSETHTETSMEMSAGSQKQVISTKSDVIMHLNAK